MIFRDRKKAASGGASADATEPPPAADDSPSMPPPSLEGERGIPPVNPRGYQSRGQLFAISGGVIALVALMWAINRPTQQPKIAPNDPHATSEQRFDEGKSNGVVAPPEASAGLLEPPKPPALANPIQVVPAIDPYAPPANAANRGARELTPLEKRMKPRTVIYDARSERTNSQAREVPGLAGLQNDGSVGTGTPQSLLPPYLTSGAASTLAAERMGGSSQSRASANASENVGADQDSVAALLRPTKLEGAAASRFPDRTLMIARGKLIDCILDTAISTQVAGMTKCTLSRDVYGENGKLIVLERGTELTGEYRSNVQTGQARLGIVWDRAKTPAGVIIQLSSPATDSLGRGGVDGYVDNHFWQRYGAAILLSSLDDALSLLANRVDENQIYIPPNTSRTGRDAASVALEANVRIPPTIVKNQGEHVGVFVARDLDFRPVYGYRPPPMASTNE